MSELTHLDSQGRAHMVDVGDKPITERRCVARGAVLMAAERGERATPLHLMPEDFERALRELIEYGGDLTRSFLGFPRPLTNLPAYD